MTHISTKVQISFLLNSAASLPNRDQNGRAKRIPYGGFTRQRISSQCYKAAMRSASYLVRTANDGDIISDTLDDFANRNDLGMAVRSRMIFARRVLPLLIEAGVSEERAKEWVENAKALFGKAKKEEGAEGGKKAEAVADDETAKEQGEGIKNEPGFTTQPLVLGEREIVALANTLSILDKEGVQPKDAVKVVTGKAGKPGKTSKKAKEDKEAKEEKVVLSEAALSAVENFRMFIDSQGRANAGIDGAFFGRFATSDLVSNVDSAVHVAHLIGVTEITAIADYFTVQDTILKGEVAGGAHQNNTELTSSLYLGTIVVDTGQLAINFGAKPGENDEDVNRLIAEAVAWIVRAIHNVNPAAKLGSTAPYGNVVETVVEIGKRQPHQHILAFERPLRPEDYKDSSLSDEAGRRLINQITESGKRYGKQKHVLVLNEMEGDGEKPAFEILADRVRDALEAELQA